MIDLDALERRYACPKPGRDEVLELIAEVRTLRSELAETNAVYIDAEHRAQTAEVERDQLARDLGVLSKSAAWEWLSQNHDAVAALVLGRAAVVPMMHLSDEMLTTRLDKPCN